MTETHFISACEAARLLGISNAAISRALTSGRLPYVNKTKHGYQIDPKVLYEVFATSPQMLRKHVSPKDAAAALDESELGALRIAKLKLEADLSSLKTQLHLERKRADAAESDRDAWREVAKKFLHE